jgi:hypothetical protein
MYLFPQLPFALVIWKSGNWHKQAVLLVLANHSGRIAGKPEVVKRAVHVRTKSNHFSWICGSGGRMLTAGP